MMNIKWLLVYIFTQKNKRSIQMNLDWNWFWKIEVPDWWSKSRINVLKYIPKKDRDDGLPF